MKFHPYQKMRKDVPQWVFDCVPEAWTFTMDHWNYHPETITIPPIRFSYNARFAKFSHGNPRYFNGIPHIRFVKRSKRWYTYKKKTAGMYADGIICPSKQVRLKISMVHEFTHAIQWYEKETLNMDRVMSEVETTETEIAYVKSHYPELYNQLKRFDNG